MNLTKIIKLTSSWFSLCLAMPPEARMLELPTENRSLSQRVACCGCFEIPTSLTIVFSGISGNEFQTNFHGLPAVLPLAKLKQAELAIDPNSPETSLPKEASNMIYDLLRDPAHSDNPNLIRYISDGGEILPPDRMKFVMSPNPELETSWNTTVNIKAIKMSQEMRIHNSAGDPVKNVARMANGICLCGSPVVFGLWSACVYTQFGNFFTGCCPISCCLSAFTVITADCTCRLATRACSGQSLLELSADENFEFYCTSRESFSWPLPGLSKRIYCCCLVR